MSHSLSLFFSSLKGESEGSSEGWSTAKCILRTVYYTRMTHYKRINIFALCKVFQKQFQHKVVHSGKRILREPMLLKYFSFWVTKELRNGQMINELILTWIKLKGKIKGSSEILSWMECNFLNTQIWAQGQK